MRPRKKDRHLPKCVYHKHGAYWLVKAGKWERLGTELPSKYKSRIATRRTKFADLIDTAMNTIRPNVGLSTWKNYQTAAEKLKYAFSEIAPSELCAADVWDFRDGYADTPNMTNRCLSLLRQVCSYAVRRRIMHSNPAVNIDPLDEKKRDRLLSMDEYHLIKEKAGPRLQCIMDMLFLTGQRVNDVLKMKRSDLTDGGIYFKQQKTGSKVLVRWTPELKAVVERIKGLSEIPAITLFQNRRRKAPDYRSVILQWWTACKAANVSNAQLRDLRAMSLTHTESEGKNATVLAGHASPSMTKRYLRGKKIAIADGPTLLPVQNTSKTHG
jgi:integrase